MEGDQMTRRISELPAVLTCFAYRREYFAEMEGMLETVRLHHPQWPVVVGRGPVEGYGDPTIEVESPSGKSLWTLPVALNLDASENDWLKIVRVKGWWMSRVWHEYGDLAEVGRNRLVWADADARFNGALDIELDPRLEVVAGPWWYDREIRDLDTICSGLLVFQGARQAVVEGIIDQWSSRCLSQIENLPPQTKPWPDSDQEVLTEVLRGHIASNADFLSIKLEHDKYVGCPVIDGKLVRRALVDSWYMIEKMRLPECRDMAWPPPEEYRRQAAIGTPVPGWNPDGDPPSDSE
jgi:hypothetical protein